MKVTPLTTSFGALLEADERSRELPTRDEVIRHFKESGLVVLRGFDALLGDKAIAAFETYTESFAKRFLKHVALGTGRDPAGHDGKTATVDHGGNELHFHAERAYLPERPDLVFFYCEVPPKEGGETNFVDGTQLLKSMDSSSRAYFDDAEVGMLYRFPRLTDSWKAVYEVSSREELNAKLKRIEESTPAAEGRFTHFFPFDSLITAFAMRPVTKTKWGNQDTFCNFLLVTTHARMLVWEVAARPGKSPPEHKRETAKVSALANSIMYKHAWKRGDFAIVDNTRVMHARSRFNDAHRRILFRYGDASF